MSKLVGKRLRDPFRQVNERLFGMTGRGHEGRIQALEKAPIPEVPGTAYETYPGAVFAIPDLRGFWRLDQATGNFLDTSGYYPASPADLSVAPNGTHLTRGVLGATSDADACIKANYAGNTGSSSLNADYLDTVALSGATSRFDFSDLDGREMSIAAYVQPAANANTIKGQIAGTTGIQVTSGTSWEDGWGLQLVYPACKVRMSRGQQALGNPNHYAESPFSLTPGQWYQVTGSYDGTNINLYVNGSLVAQFADSRDCLSSLQMRMLATNLVDDAGLSYFGYYKGLVDEVAVWAHALTAAEVRSLWLTGGVPPTSSSSGIAIYVNGS